MEIPISLDQAALKFGIKHNIVWEPTKAPHMVVFGGTGSGKTVCVKNILGKIELYLENTQIYVCDFKGDTDFEFLTGSKRFYRFAECQQGLQDFYTKLEKRQHGEDKTRNMLILLFDEWASYLNHIEDKKVLEAEKKKLASLLMLGRSFNIQVIISQQRVDAQYFNTARDNFNVVIGLGNLSEESKRMFFSDYMKEIEPIYRQGAGYMLMNGSNFKAIQVPKITKWDILHKTIKQAVDR